MIASTHTVEFHTAKLETIDPVDEDSNQNVPVVVDDDLGQESGDSPDTADANLNLPANDNTESQTCDTNDTDSTDVGAAY